MSEKNLLFLCGKISSIEESHVYLEEKFYKCFIEVSRLSNMSDSLPFVVSEKLLYNNEILIGDLVFVSGQLRTRNQTENGKNKLIIFGYATEIRKIEEDDSSIINKNEVEIEGFICKKPTFRKTPSGRKISDLLIASNRYNNKSDYIPSIAWGVNAVFVNSLPVGQKIVLTGRFQSRKYLAKDEKLGPQEKKAYEVSIVKIDLFDKEDK